MATVCANCGKTLKKGEGGFMCSECYTTYCENCGYQYTNDNGEFVCMNCKGQLSFFYEGQ